MSLRTQAKVLRVLQDGEVEPVGAARTLTVDVRVVAATNKALDREIAEGRFREDLYFRLNVVPIHLPALRERPEDIAPLVRHFAETFCRESNYRPKAFAAGAIDALSRLPWRGNVRELRNAVERLIVLTPQDTIQADDLPVGLGLALGGSPGAAAAGQLTLPHAGLTLQQFKDAAERAFLITRLREHDWNYSATAKAIDTPRSNLYKKRDAYGIEREEEAARERRS
jgi:two-component system nitrogen regulation response regulator NtrX